MKMKCPEGGTGCSFDGVEYTADDKGVVDVPAEAGSALLDHGFTVVQGNAQDTADADAAEAERLAAEQKAADQKAADDKAASKKAR